MSEMPLISNGWRRIEPFLRHRYLTLAMRIGLGGVFIIAGYGKLCGISIFVGAVKMYEILPDSLAAAYGYPLPFVEFEYIGCELI